MAIKQYNPTTPAQRGMTTQDFSGITAKKPLKSLIVSKKTSSGRNNQGRITTRHRGAGVRRHYRLINFKLHDGMKATVEQIEYDPNRSARIARVKDENGGYHYVLAVKGMRPGRKFSVGEEATIEAGNRLPLKNIPTGSVEYASVRLPSGEIRMININSMATIGTIGNEQHQNIQIGKAGRKRKMGIRPTVRGVVMNAVDHPHGGGDGGRHRMARPPTTPWGQKTLGYKTRRRKASNKFIVKTRHQGKRRG
jgi:large subunit ribosomal protein L2